MKRFTLITLAVLFIAALGAGSAFAETYQVTAGYGVRVIEQGSCEQVGSITLEGQTPSDLFVNGTTITVELLGGATICRNVGASYTFGGPGVIPTAINTWDPAVSAPVLGAGEEYYIEAVTGDDYFIIEIVATSVIGDRVIVGHELESYLCFNLQGTIYNASDPNLQLVQVSYRDSDENTYSGDSYVATVKPQTISFGICATGKYADVYTREICYIPGTQAPECGYDFWSSACLFRFTDNSVGELDGTYEITVGKTAGAKAGIGFSDIFIQYAGTGAWIYPNPLTTVRRNSAGVVLDPANYGGFGEPPIEALYAETSQITVQVNLLGPGTYYVYGQGYAYAGPGDCPFEPGDWIVDISGRKIPCGHSFSDLDRVILHTTECNYGQYPEPYCMTFPFGAGSWMNGLVLDNPNSHDQVFTALIHEADGDMYTAQATIAAMSMAVDLVENIFTITIPDATDSAPFDEDYWLQITSDDDPFFGYMFIFDGTMANGYRPICCTPSCYID